MTRRKDMTFPTKVLEVKDAEGGASGTVKALVSVFGNRDSYGDRVIKEAFADTLAEWRASGDPIPFIWSHQWRDLDAHIGYVPPEKAVETDRGLEVEAHVDLETDTDRKIYRLLKARRIRQFSFAFDVEEEEYVEGDDDDPGSYELRKLRLFECGPCLLGANEETDLLEVAEREAVRERAKRARHESTEAAAEVVKELQSLEQLEVDARVDELASDL